MANNDEYVVVPPQDLSQYTGKKIISSHCMVYARLPGRHVLEKYENYLARGAVLMQMRFDGKLGFPGGLVDENESPEDAVNREMEEEMNFDVSQHKVESKDHVVSLFNKNNDAIHHFYSLEVTESELKSIERRALDAKDYGDEVFGTLRVPLYTRHDGVTGFPTFLNNVFVGCSYSQLLAGLRLSKLLSAEEIEEAEKIAAKNRQTTFKC